jgi:predicted nucleic-acid-binding Zn-ribbon protein
MSSVIGDTSCRDCGSENAYLEEFRDSEEGYIEECSDCNYTVVYREDVATGRVIEDYRGFDHFYSGQFREMLKKEGNPA